MDLGLVVDGPRARLPAGGWGGVGGRLMLSSMRQSSMITPRWLRGARRTAVVERLVAEATVEVLDSGVLPW